MSDGKDIEVSLQYADINKIRLIMVKQKKLIDPKMFIISSDERMKVAAMMSDGNLKTTESVSIDFFL